jgi:hypothetical protein
MTEGRKEGRKGEMKTEKKGSESKEGADIKQETKK